jgi:hypothetical protein
MTKTFSNYPRILSLAPCTYGLGYARVEGLNSLADWGTKCARGNKNAACRLYGKKLIELHQPEVIVLEDTSDRNIRRHLRVQQLTLQLVSIGKKHKVPVVVLRRKDVYETFFGEAEGTKYALAKMIAQRFPDELGSALPPKRRLWMSEDYRMGIFAAVALALAFRRTLKIHQQ